MRVNQSATSSRIHTNRETTSEVVPYSREYSSISQIGQSLRSLIRTKNRRIAHSGDLGDRNGPTEISRFHEVFGAGVYTTTTNTDDLQLHVHSSNLPSIQSNVELDEIQFGSSSAASTSPGVPDSTNDAGCSTKPSGHVECMLVVMNYMCVSPYRRDDFEEYGYGCRSWKRTLIQVT